MSAATAAARAVRADVQALDAYCTPAATGWIKLDAMENPYPLPAALQAAWRERLAGVALNRYPDPEARGVKQALRKAMAIPPGAGIVLGNGSDELIQLVAMAVGEPSRPVLAPAPSFVMYEMVARFLGRPFVAVPLAPDFALDREALLAAIARDDPACVFLAYPNNPTGNCFASDTIEAVIRATRGLVVIDEAYHAFSGCSFLTRLTEFDNLVVMRTLSKVGLAGLRFGYLVGPPAWLDQINKLRLPYNINVLTQASVELLLQHHAVLEQQAVRICAARLRLAAELAAVEGFSVYPSEANFILVRAPAGRASAIYRGLLEQGILIKNLDQSVSLLADCLRVTVGGAEENAQLLDALTRIA